MADNEYATPLLLRTHGLSESVVPMERVCIQNKKDQKRRSVWWIFYKHKFLLNRIVTQKSKTHAGVFGKVINVLNRKKQLRLQYVTDVQIGAWHGRILNIVL